MFSSGVVGLVAADAELVPTEFVAVTVQVYVASFVNPETVMGDEVLEPLTELAPSVQVAAYPVIALPPLFAVT